MQKQMHYMVVVAENFQVVQAVAADTFLRCNLDPKMAWMERRWSLLLSEKKSSDRFVVAECEGALVVACTAKDIDCKVAVGEEVAAVAAAWPSFGMPAAASDSEDFVPFP